MWWDMLIALGAGILAGWLALLVALVLMRPKGALLAELETETARGRATYAEVEESEADLERFDKWLAKIAARDYFAAGGGLAARQAVECCRDALAAFEDAAIAAQAGQSPAGPPASARLRAVD